MKKGSRCRALEKAAKIAGLDLRFNQAASTDSIYVSCSDADLSIRISDHTKKVWSCGEQVVRDLDIADEIESAADEIVRVLDELPEYTKEQLESFKAAWHAIAQTIRNRRAAAQNAAKKAQATRAEKAKNAIEIARKILRSEKCAKFRTKSGKLKDNRHLAFYRFLTWHMPDGVRVSKEDARKLYYQEMYQQN